MFNGKYTTLNRVLENISRDIGYEEQLYKDDVVEWAVRAMNLIGVNIAYDTVMEKLTVADFKTTIPANVVDIIGMRDFNTKRALVPSTDEFIIGLVDEDMSDLEALYGADVNMPSVKTYQIRNGYIFFNFETGYIEIMYRKYKVDSDGIPVVPDVDRYLMAIEAYIIYKIDSKLYRRGKISREVKQESEQNWLWYVNSAANKMLTPDYGVAENLSRRAQSMRAATDSQSGNFDTLNFPTIKRF